MSWSTAHISKTTRPPIVSTRTPSKPHHRSNPSKTPLGPSSSSSTMSILNDIPLPTVRTSSLAGKKRPRESDEHGRLKPSRRTKSLGDPMDQSARDREAFQRGLIAVFVPNALQESQRGNMTHYNELLAHFQPTPTTPIPVLAPLLPLLRAITAHVSLLSPHLHGGLVSAILALPWATGDDRFVKSFMGFAGVLVSAEPSWAKEVVGMAIRGLTWQPSVPGPSTITRRIYHARQHLLLSHLISLIPTLPNIISSLLVKHFPHKREPEIFQTTYVRNITELVGYCPELCQRAWSEIIDRMLRIDVEITQRSEDDEDEDDEEDADDQPIDPSSRQDPFDLLITESVPREPSLSPTSSENGDSDSDADPDPEDLSTDEGERSETDEPKDLAKQLREKEKKRLLLKSMRSKLDGMLHYFFEHIAEYMGGGPSRIPAEELAAATLNSSGASTPLSEVATPITPLSTTGSILPSPAARPAPSAAEALAHFQTLLNLFSRQILPTSSTQHIPFLLFLTSSFSNAHTDLFLGLLVQQALYATSSTGSNAPISTSQRVAATVYIGSIVCRARFVSDDQARTVLTYLLAYIDGKLHSGGRPGKAEDLPLFYAVCQAAMLIFCFRWRAFLLDSSSGIDGIIGGEMDLGLDEEEHENGDGGSGKWMKDLDILSRAITSEWNPLLGCNPTIVSTFAKVAHQTNFFYCFSILESNASAARSSSSTTLSRNNSTAKLSTASLSVPRAARQTNIDSGLDGYFPFDPYDLPRSGEWLERLYRTWDEVAVDAADSDDDESDEESDGESEGESDDSEASGKPVGRSLPKAKPMGGSSFDRRRLMIDNGLSSSLEGMSISPTTSMGKGMM